MQQTLEAASSRDCCFTLDHVCVCEPNIKVLNLICTELLGQINQQCGLIRESKNVLVNNRLMANLRLYKAKGHQIHDNGLPDRFNLQTTKQPSRVLCVNGNPLNDRGQIKLYRSILYQILNNAVRLQICQIKSTREKERPQTS